MKKLVSQPYLGFLLFLFGLSLSQGAEAQDNFDNQVDLRDDVFYFYLEESAAAAPTKIESHTIDFYSNNKTYPRLYNAYQVEEISYTSSVPGVATVNASTGAVQAVGVGSTVISAVFAGNYAFFPKTVSYTLTIIDGRLTLEDLGVGFSSSSANVAYGDANASLPSLNMGKFVDATLNYSSSAPGVATVNGTGQVTIVGAGQTVISASFDGNDNVKPGSVSYTLTVAKKEVGLEWGTASFTYDGKPHVPTATATGLVGNDVCTVTVDGAQTDAGNYTATASSLSNSSYKLPSANTTAFSIAKAASAVATAPVANKLSYTGSPQALVTAGTCTGGTMQYSLDGNAYTEAVPTGTDVGSYTVYYKVAGDKNHEDAAGGQVAVSIAKADVTVTFASKTAEAKLGEAYKSQTATVSPSGLTLAYSSSDTGVATVDAATGVVTLVSAGSTTITASFAGDGNYNSASDSYKLTVSKADPGVAELSFASATVTATYGDGKVNPPALNNPQQLPLSWSSSNEKVATVGNNGVMNVVGTGETVITASFAGNDTYQAKSASFTLIVEKYTVTVWFSSASMTATLGEPFASPKASASPKNMPLTYVSSETSVAIVNADTGEVTLKGAGTTRITASFKGTSLYTAASAYYDLTVKEAEKGLEPIVKEVDYPMDDKYFVNADGSEVDLSNIVINNILFTLKNQSSPTGDGFDTEGHYIVINIPTLTSTVNTLLANGVKPGSSDYASQFTGMTFLVPQGEGYIIINSQEAEGVYLMVKVGANDPVAINMPEMGDYNIPYKSDKPTYVYMWKGGSDAVSGTHTRGKKEMVDVRVRKISYKSAKSSGIQQVVLDASGDQPWYDLSGQKISQPVKKGVYIHGHRKVVIK